eukprot:g23903.t1
MLEVALMERLGERSLQVMGEFKVQESERGSESSQDIAGLAWSLGVCSFPDPSLFDAFAACTLQIAHFDAQDLANGMWSFAKLEERPPERLWCSWPDQVFQTLQDRTPPHLRCWL